MRQQGIGERMGYTWWRAQSVRYIMRPNRWFVEYLAAAGQRLSFDREGIRFKNASVSVGVAKTTERPAPNDALEAPIVIPPFSISIHVRRSDKVGSFSKGKEMDAVPLSEYVEHAEQIRRCRCRQCSSPPILL